MKRWFGVAVVTMGMALGACSSKQSKPADPGPSAPAFTPAPDDQAIVGTWSDGRNTFVFNGNGTYTWSAVVPCGAPTCQEAQKAAGSYQFRTGRILLGGGAGAQGDLSVSYSFSNNQATLTLNDGSSNWMLNRR